PLQLSATPAPPGAINSVNNLFLGTGPSQSDFAIAVSKEYVTTKFAPTLDKLREFQQSFEVELPSYIPWPNPTYHLSVTGVDLKFNVGWIDLVIHAKATTRAVGFPDYDPIDITQRLKIGVGLMLIVDAGGANKVLNIILTADGDPIIKGITGLYSGTATNEARKKIIAQRDKDLPAAQIAIGTAFQDALTQLQDGLVKLDPAASASYTAVEINPDGIIVRGAVNTKYHYQPQMEIG